MFTQTLIESMSKREAYLSFLILGGNIEEFNLLPTPLNVADDFLYQKCEEKMKKLETVLVINEENTAIEEMNEKVDSQENN